MSEDLNKVFDDISVGQQSSHQKLGFQEGYSAGEHKGWHDGYVFGLKEGAKIAAEIGYYHGFAQTWIEILQQQEDKQRQLHSLQSLLEMTTLFPRKNDEDCLVKLTKIRAKFKQVNSMLGNKGSHGLSWTTEEPSEVGCIKITEF